MNLHTTYMSNYRKAKGCFVDITIKSGNQMFAPTWKMVSDYKDGKLSEEEYTSKYLELMRQSFKKNKKQWMDLLQKDEVTLACYCYKGFCHRYLLADILGKIAKSKKIDFKYYGEL